MHPVNIHRTLSSVLVAVFCLLFFGGMGVMLIAAGTDIGWPLSLFGAFLLALVIYSVVRYWWLSPGVYLDEHYVIFNGRRRFPLSELEHCDEVNYQFYPLSRPARSGASILLGLAELVLMIAALTGNGDGYSGTASGSNTIKATLFRFRDGRVRYIMNDCYRNAWLLKNYYDKLHQHTTGLSAVVDPILTAKSATGPFGWFSGSQLSTLFGIVNWLFVGLTVILLVTGQPIFLLFLPVSMLLFFVVSNRMHCFGVSKQHLIVRKHNMPWANKAFDLSDIKEVVLEMDNVVRIVPINWQEEAYKAPTLSRRSLDKLKDAMEAQGVTVHDARIYLYPF